MHWKYMSSISLFINYLYYSIYKVIIYCRKRWIKFFRKELGFFFHFEILNHSLCFTCSHLFSFAITVVFIPYHSLLFVITLSHSLLLVVTRGHSLLLVAPLVVAPCYLLAYVVTRCTTRCHLLSLVDTRCTSRLSFYKRLLFHALNKASMKISYLCDSSCTPLSFSIFFSTFSFPFSGDVKHIEFILKRIWLIWLLQNRSS